MKKIFDTALASRKEREEVVRRLRNGNISYYETPSTGRTLGAFWVRSEENYIRARQIIEKYEKSLANRSREEYELRLKRDFDGSELNWFLYNLKKHKIGIPVGVALTLFVVWHLILVVVSWAA